MFYTFKPVTDCGGNSFEHKKKHPGAINRLGELLLTVRSKEKVNHHPQ
jgi:hypothetical protein